MSDFPVESRAGVQFAGQGGNMVFCRGCGAQIHAEAAACPKCGAPQKPARAQAGAAASARDRTIAVVLALILGGLGAHKFYLGKWGQGILYFIFCWTLIPGIIAFIEAIVYLTLSEDEFRRRYP